jgi:hypothetical protein
MIKMSGRHRVRFHMRHPDESRAAQVSFFTIIGSNYLFELITLLQSIMIVGIRNMV